MVMSDTDQWAIWFGTIVLIVFISWDIWKAYSTGSFWIPGKLLVLTSLTIQLLEWLEPEPLEDSDLDSDYYANQVSMDLAKYTLCVFMGYLVPGMASPTNRDTWVNTLALFLSLSTRIGKESYLNDAINDFFHLKKISNKMADYMLGSMLNMILLVLMIGLVGLLGLAVVAGKFISRNLSLRIPLLLPIVENENYSSGTMEYEMLKCWIVVRLCQPEYVLARSGFSAAALALVTFPVVIAPLECYEFIHDVSPLLFGSMFFILIGWFIIFYRWLNVVFYFPSFTLRNSWELFAAVIRCYNQLNDRFLMILSPSKKYFRDKQRSFLLRVAVALALSPALVVLIIMILIWMGLWMVILVSSSLIILLLTLLWGLSALLSKVVMKIVKRRSNDEEFLKYQDALQWLVMPGEDPADLWRANRKYFHHKKSLLKTGYKEGLNCEELIEAVTSSRARNSLRSFVNRLEPLMGVNELFPMLKKPLWMITAICLLNIMLGVVPFAGEHEDEEIHLKLDRAIKAYEQAHDLLDFADCPTNVGVKWNIFGNCNAQSLALRHVADKQIKTIKTRYKDLENERLAKHVHHTITVEEIPESRKNVYGGVLQSIKDLYGAAECDLKKEYLLGDLPFKKKAYGVYSDWKSAGPSYAMYKVCNIILVEVPRHDNVLSFFNELVSFFRDVIASCLSESQELILNSCKQWAAEFEEEKISSSMFIAGKLEGVMNAVK